MHRTLKIGNRISISTRKSAGAVDIMIEADKAIKACGISSREYREIILSCNTYKGYIWAGYGTADKFMRRYNRMRLLGYECKTIFWSDFSIAERFGVEAMKDAYNRTMAEWEKDGIYGTELSMALNHRCLYWRAKQNEGFSKLYARLRGRISWVGA